MKLTTVWSLRRSSQGGAIAVMAAIMLPLLLGFGALVIDMARWRDSAKSLTPADLTRLILDESGYTDALQAERSVESAGRLENLNELARAMEEYETLGDFLEHVSLVMDNDRGNDLPSITVMTNSCGAFAWM